jgi:hypothetical protein
MATVKIEALSEKYPGQCGGRRAPMRNGRFYEFRDATEEELAFWNVLDDGEKKELTGEAFRRCFFDVLHEFMQVEAEKGRKMKEAESSFQQPESEVPPNSPPSPPGPNQPPILDDSK